MIADLKPYPEYKGSGLPWLGDIPAHWQVRRAKYFLREVDERSHTGKELLLSVSHLTGVTPRSEKAVSMFLAKSNIGHKVCRPNDVVINTLWAWMAALGVSRRTGLVSPAYGVYRPLAETRLNPHFLDHLLRSPRYAAEYLRRSTGVNSSRMRLYPEQFLGMSLVYPPPQEQAAIVRFLDFANARLSAAVRAKRRELALISEMLKVVTEQALQLEGTRKLRLSTVSDVLSRPVDRDPERLYTRIGLYNRGRGIFHKTPTAGTELGDSEFSWVEDGDLVISGQFAWEGAVALARSKDSGCVASHRYPILRGREEYVSSAVLLALFRTTYGAMLLDHHSRGAAGRNRPLNPASLLKEEVPVPPMVAQARIAQLLDQEYLVVQALGKTIQFVNEYRARLVTDVVTGQLDVREAAARMPDDTDGPGPRDEDDSMIHAEVGGADEPDAEDAEA